MENFIKRTRSRRSQTSNGSFSKVSFCLFSTSIKMQEGKLKKVENYSIYTLNPWRHSEEMTFIKHFSRSLVVCKNLSLVLRVLWKLLNINIHITFSLSERRPFTITPGRERGKRILYISLKLMLVCECAVQIVEKLLKILRTKKIISYWIDT